MEKVGMIYVDAGCVMVGDPCYTQGDDASSHVRDWSTFLHLTYPEVFNADGTINHDAKMPQVAQALGEEGVGIVVESGYGDGEYPVYVERDSSGRVAALTVAFISDEDQEEDPDFTDDPWYDEDHDSYVEDVELLADLDPDE